MRNLVQILNEDRSLSKSEIKKRIKQTFKYVDRLDYMADIGEIGSEFYDMIELCLQCRDDKVVEIAKSVYDKWSDKYGDLNDDEWIARTNEFGDALDEILEL